MRIQKLDFSSVSGKETENGIMLGHFNGHLRHLKDWQAVTGRIPLGPYSSIWCRAGITSLKARWSCTQILIPPAAVWFAASHFNLFWVSVPSSGKLELILLHNIVLRFGTSGWLSGWASAFGSGHDPGIWGWSPTSGSLRGACFSLCLYLCLSVCVSRE